jgi:DNA primase
VEAQKRRIEDIKARYDCRDIAELVIGDGKHMGEYNAYRCPFHRGNKYSFTVWADGWRCWADCDTGGDVITLVMRTQHLQFKDALDWLDGKTTLATINTKPLRRHEPDAPAMPPDMSWQTFAKLLADRTAQKLWDDDERSASARAYLLARGLSLDTLRSTGIGFIPADDQYQLLYGRVISDKWQHNGKPVRVPCGVSIPTYEPNAERSLWGVKVRRLARTDPKYLGVPGGSKALYIPRPFVPGRPLMLVEGEFDALIVLQEAGDLVNAAALGSASNAAINWRWHAYLASCPVIYARMDSDGAGAKALAKLTEGSKRVYEVKVPEEKDVNDFHLRCGAGAVRQWIGGLV